ncbi:MAG: polysaccharide biosynthesis C-terminal domain-containing protein [Pyrinomonadaceae bacterium]
MQNRSARLILNSIYSLLSWLAPVALGILVTPFILRRLGVEAYGVYLVILGVIGYSFTFNVGRAVAKFVAEYRASGDIHKINSTITASFYISLVVGVLGAFVLAFSAEWFVTELLQISPAFQRTATTALIIGGFSIPLTLAGQVFQNVLQGTHRFGAVSLITSLNSLLLNAGNVVLVILGFGIDALILWTLTVITAIAALTYVTARRSEPEYRIEFASAGRMLRPVAAYGSSIFLYQLFGSALLVFERAWVTRNFGAETAAYYLVPMGLAIYFHGFMTSLTSAAFPVLNELLNDRDRSIELYRKVSKLLLSLTVLFLFSVYFGAEAFLAVWIDSGFAERSYRILMIHSLTFSFIVLLLASWQLNEANGSVGSNALLTGIWACVTIPLMLLLANEWHAEGVAVSRTIGVAATLPMIFYVERRFLGAVQWRFWASVAVKIAAAAIVLSVIEYFVFSRMAPGWSELILGWGLGSLAYIFVLYFTGLITKDEESVVLGVFGLGRAAVK